FMQLELLVAAIERGTADRLAVEEIVLGLIGSVIHGGDGPDGRQSPVPARRSRAGTSRAHAELAHDAERVLSARYAESLSLGELARTVGSSPFHLARVFRSE